LSGYRHHGARAGAIEGAIGLSPDFGAVAHSDR